MGETRIGVPVVQNLQATVEGGEIHVTFGASDTFSAIHNAEFSIDAGDWQYVAPVGEISDAKQENYDFSAPVPVAKPDIGEAQPVLAPEQIPLNAKQAKENKKRATAPAVAPTGPEEHVVVVRIYDRFDNMGTAKVVVRPAK